MKDTEPHYANTPPEELPSFDRNPVHVVLDNLRSAFNVGSIFRTADAAAAQHIHLCGMTARPPNPKLVKTALGAMDYVPWTYHENATRALSVLGEGKIFRVAVEVAEDAVPYLSFDWPRPVAIVFGHEVRGIAPEVLGLCDAKVRIPMHGYKNTINVATAFGVILYDILRRWGV